MKRLLPPLAVAILSLLLFVPTKPQAACGTAGSSTITNLPGLGGFDLRVNALGSAGQITGYSYLPGDQEAHAFLYSSGSVIDLGTFNGPVSQGFGINGSAVVVGEADLPGQTATHAFRYSGGGLVDLGTLGGNFSRARAINNLGHIVGDSTLAGDAASSAFYYANGSMTNLGTLGGESSSAVDVNQNDGIAGNSTLANGELHAFLHVNGAMMDLGTLGGDYSFAFDLNDSGAVAGESYNADFDTRGFVYSGGVMHDVGTLGGTYSSALAINNAGQAIGDASTTNDLQWHGFVYSSGAIHDLGTLGGNYSSAKAINNAGQIVGEAETGTGSTHAFLWQNGTMVDLNSLLPAGSGWELFSALFINDAGRIVGRGARNGVGEWFIMDVSSANNHPPIAVAGPNQTVDCQGQVTLDGSASSDPDGDPLRYEWHEGANLLGTNVTVTATVGFGIHTFTLRVTDPCGEFGQTNVMVTVADTTEPEITSVPGPFTVSSGQNCEAVVPNVVSNVVASDNCTPANQLTVTQSPVAGSSLGFGQHTIVVTVTDANNNSTSASVTMNVVDTMAPTITTVPGPLTVSSGANCQAGAPNVVSGVVAFDNCTPANQLTVTQSPVAGTLLGPGQHTIVVTVKDASNNSVNANVTVNVVDASAPVITSVPGPFTLSVGVNCQAAVPNVLSGVVANDNCTPVNQLTVTQSPVAGTLLGLGQHTIVVTVKDASNNSATANVTVNVVDTIAPVITSVPGPLTVSAGANGQAATPNVVSGVVAGDSCTAVNQLTVTQSPLAGTPLGLGQHTIVVTVRDASNNSATASVTVNVVDTTAPVITSAPTSLTVPSNSNCEGTVPNVVPSIVATDNCTPSKALVVTQSPAAGTVLGAGQHTIVVTVTDGSNNSATVNIALTISGGGGSPVISDMSVSPSVLWSPNHQMVPVTVTVTATGGGCGVAPVSKIVSITANGTCDPGDIEITGNLTANLAATKNASGTPRVYTIKVCTTTGSKSTTSCVYVFVPKDNSKSLIEALLKWKNKK